MIDERERSLDGAGGDHARRWTAFDHDDLDAERAGCGNLPIGGAAAGILRHNDIDAFVPQQFLLVDLGKGAARQDIATVPYGKRRIDRIDAADEIAVLGRGGKTEGLLPSNGKEDPAPSASQRFDGTFGAIDPRPAIAFDRFPRRPAQGEERNTRSFGGGRRVLRDLGGEGMGRVDEQVDACLSQVINESVDAAEATDPAWQGQGLGIAGAARKRHRRVESAGCRKLLGQTAGLCRAPQNQNAALAHG